MLCLGVALLTAWRGPRVVWIATCSAIPICADVAIEVILLGHRVVAISTNGAAVMFAVGPIAAVNERALLLAERVSATCVGVFMWIAPSCYTRLYQHGSVHGRRLQQRGTSGSALKPIETIRACVVLCLGVTMPTAW